MIGLRRIMHRSTGHQDFNQFVNGYSVTFETAMRQVIAATALANASFGAILGASGRTTADGARTIIVDIPA